SLAHRTTWLRSDFHDFAAQWAGQGAALARELPAAELLRTLVEELRG
ncbi:nitronate monooxygenase, partial [Pseudomonas aeruginosa]|nr:nitronate monooxygenase [Pseudomonas aeruginosa]